MSETMGECERSVIVASDGPCHPHGERRAIASAIDRLAADVAEIKEAVCGNRPEKLDSSPAAPPAGWLTEEERELLQSRLHALRVYLRSLCKPGPGSVTREVKIISAILARAGSPPVVEVPPLGFAVYGFDSPFSIGEYRAGYREACLAHRDALDKAGVAWKEVGRE